MKFDPVPLIILGLGVIIGAIFVVVGVSKGAKQFESNKNYVAGTPKLEVSEKSFYLAQGIKISQKDVILTNSGDGSLTLSNFLTSSNLLSARLVSDDKDSPIFSGGLNSDWQTNLDPKGEIILRITFDKDRFDWDNPTDQFVSFKTNDPESPTMKIKFVTNPSDGDFQDEEAVTPSPTPEYDNPLNNINTGGE